MNRHRTVSSPTDKHAQSRAYTLGILACISVYPAFIGVSHAALALGWHA